MLNHELIEYLQADTPCSDLDNPNLIDESPLLEREIKASSKANNMVSFFKELAEKLTTMDIYKASLLSQYMGFICQKTDNTSSGRYVLDLFACSCPLVYDLFKYIEKTGDQSILEDQKALYALNPQWARAYYGFNLLCISAMAFLAKDAKLRKTLLEMDIHEKLQYLAEEAPSTPYLHSVHYVDNVQYTCGKLDLLVLHPQKKKGFIATANDLENCFHLFFLLEEQIHQQLSKSYDMNGYSVDPSLASLAHGEHPKDCWGKSYSTYFTECDYSSTFSTKNELLKGNMVPLVWGEMPPDYIPSINDQAIIVLWENFLPRSFSAEFMAVGHPALDPYVKIERELTDEEYNMWLKLIKEASEQ